MKTLTKIILGSDIGQIIAEKIIRTTIRKQFGVDVALTIKKCEINGSDHDTTIADVSVSLEINNDDLNNIVNQLI